MNSTESPVNRLTSSHTDKVTHTRRYKEAAVNMRVCRIAERAVEPAAANQPPFRPSDSAERAWKSNGMEAPRLSHARERQRETVTIPRQENRPMAQPNPLEIAPGDPRRELQCRLQNAPLEHAEALLAAYNLLQELHDRRRAGYVAPACWGRG